MLHPTDLEREVGLGLRSLPDVPAPASLLPRVMAAVHAWSVRPWYERAWFTWPIPLQIASCTVLTALVTGAVLLSPALDEGLRGLAQPLAGPVQSYVNEITGDVAGGVGALRSVWSALIQPLLLAASPVVALMGALCATLGLALSRFASGRAFQP
jgi:hypothetical protein